MKRIFTMIAVAVVALAGSGLMLAQGKADVKPLDGTWKLNPANSKFSPGPAPKSQTIKYETQGDTWKVSSDTVNADGTTGHLTYTAKFDGKENPVTGDPDRDSATLKRIDAYTTEVVGTKAGKPTVTYRRVLSKYGKTLTLRETGTDGKGQKVNNIQVYDKE
jgi:hypothetical protein